MLSGVESFGSNLFRLFLEGFVEADQDCMKPPDFFHFNWRYMALIECVFLQSGLQSHSSGCFNSNLIFNLSRCVPSTGKPESWAQTPRSTLPSEAEHDSTIPGEGSLALKVRASYCF